MNKRQRDQENAEGLPRPASFPTLSILHGLESLTVSRDMIVAETDTFVVTVHPKKAAFVHLVVIPLTLPSHISLLGYTQGVTAFVESFTLHHSTPRDIERFLQRFGGVSPAWGGPMEVAKFMSMYATTETIMYRCGVFVTTPDLSTLQFHIVSGDLSGIGPNDVAGWNLYTSPKYFLPPAAVDQIAALLGTPLPTAKQIHQLLTMTQLRCPCCGIPSVTVAAVRKHILSSHNQRDLSKSTTTPGTNSVSTAEQKLPLRPTQTDCKDDISSVMSLLSKWARFYHELSLMRQKDTTLPSVKQKIDTALIDAGKVLESLQSKPFLTTGQKQTLQCTQKRIRDTVFKGELL